MIHLIMIRLFSDMDKGLFRLSVAFLYECFGYMADGYKEISSDGSVSLGYIRRCLSNHKSVITVCADFSLLRLQVWRKGKLVKEQYL